MSDEGVRVVREKLLASFSEPAQLMLALAGFWFDQPCTFQRIAVLLDPGLVPLLLVY